MDYKGMTLTLIDKYYERLLSKLEELRNGKGKITIIWGTGAIACTLYHYLNKYGKKVNYFCDNNLQMAGLPITSAGGVICLTPDETLQIKDADIIIASTSIDEIETQIKNSGYIGNIIKPPVDMLVFMSIISCDLEYYSKKSIIDNISQLFDIVVDEISRKILYFKIWGWFATSEDMKQYTFNDILTSNQYIPDGIININKNSTIVDCGAYIGDTLDFFIKHDIQFQRYIAYELDKNNFQLLDKFVQNYNDSIKRKIAIYNLGVGGEKNSKVSFLSKEYSSLIIDTNEQTEAYGTSGEIVDLDSHLGDYNISYIKMDIEGFEMSALKGAKKLISKEHPDCAICIYHKATDLWQIPLFLKSCCPDYQFYIRHHANCYFDTVCYAIGGNQT
ncbi:MAG: FkbM family methyltransferase [Eubacterium sp.]|nr:FkbM family methyltransferase [Eubacterium sp.]